MKDNKSGNENEGNFDIQKIHFDNQRIEIWIKNSDGKYSEDDINRLIFNYFQKFYSLIPPFFMKPPLTFMPIDSRQFGMGMPKIYGISENNVDIDNDDYDEYLADMTIAKYPDYLLIFINLMHFDFDHWGKLSLIIKALIKKMQELKFDVESVRPAELQNLFLLESPGMLNQPSQISVSPWEKIKDHASDREILRLWHQGLTNSEIGRKVNLSGRSITNIISMLRKEYGNEIVPTNEERKRKKSP